MESGGGNLQGTEQRVHVLKKCKNGMNDTFDFEMMIEQRITGLIWMNRRKYGYGVL